MELTKEQLEVKASYLSQRVARLESILLDYQIQSGEIAFQKKEEE